MLSFFWPINDHERDSYTLSTNRFFRFLRKSISDVWPSGSSAEPGWKRRDDTYKCLRNWEEHPSHTSGGRSVA